MIPGNASRFWARFPAAYRAQEMATLASWITTGESGTIIGLAGVGRSTLLGFLCHRPDVVQSYLAPYARPAILIPVDLNNMPDNRLATLHRIILRSFYEIRERFDPSRQQTIVALYRKHEGVRDPFLSQSALRELLLLFQDQETRVVLVMNRFDTFCQTATLPMTTSLRGLRDDFKDTLCFIMGMRQDVVYLSYLNSIKPLRGILDTQVCWVGPLNNADARHMIANETRFLQEPMPERDMVRVLDLTGGYPSLIRVVCHWWLAADRTAVSDWTNELLSQQNTTHRLNELWNGLTQAEKSLLLEIQKLQTRSTAKEKARERAFQGLGKQYPDLLKRLTQKGVCRQLNQQWPVVGQLVAAYVNTVAGVSQGNIWLDQETGDIYQGKHLATNLKPMERSILQFLISHPRKRHTYTDLIEAAWPNEVYKEGVSTEALYQTIRGLRKNIEPNTADPCYIINWRGQPEGGYQFFPEGRPSG